MRVCVFVCVPVAPPSPGVSSAAAHLAVRACACTHAHNPEVLQHDGHWRAFLAFVRERKGCVGVPVVFRDEQPGGAGGEEAGGEDISVTCVLCVLCVCVCVMCFVCLCVRVCGAAVRGVPSP